MNDEITQRRVDASTAPPVATSAVGSPFAMGAKYLAEAGPVAAAAPENRNRSDLPARLVQTLEACGPLNVQQIAEALGTSYETAASLASNCTARGKIHRLTNMRKATGGSTYGPLQAAAPKSGFKKWLAKKGEPSAEGKAPRKKAAKAPAPAIVVPPPARAADLASALRYALFNDGSLRLEAGDSALTLPPAQTQELLVYLQRVSVVIGGRDGR